MCYVCYLFKIFMQRLLDISHHIMSGDRNEYSKQKNEKIVGNRNEIVPSDWQKWNENK